MFNIAFDTDNSAFEDWHIEVSRILRVIASKIEQGQECGIVFDLNGNKVGTFDKYQ